MTPRSTLLIVSACLASLFTAVAAPIFALLHVSFWWLAAVFGGTFLEGVFIIGIVIGGALGREP